MKHRLIMFGAAMCVLLTGCVQDPTSSTPDSVPDVLEGDVLVLCEGLWRYDNSVLSHVRTSPAQLLVRDRITSGNNGQKLGDLASDMVIRGDTMWIVVSGSRAIEKFRVSTGAWMGRVSFPAGREPFRMVIVNDSVAYITNRSDDSMTELDPRTLTERVAAAPTGPAPEGIAVWRTSIFVCNSGFGDLRADEPLAGTITVYSRVDLAQTGVVDSVPNVGEIVVDVARAVLVASYRELTSTDKDGGVVVIDPASLKILTRVRYDGPSDLALDPLHGVVYVLHAEGVDELDLTTSATRRILSNTTSDVWYSIAYDESRDLIWVGNAKNYVTDGEVFAVQRNGTRWGSGVGVGVNPTTILLQTPKN
jgi:hypothetical protein